MQLIHVPEDQLLPVQVYLGVVLQLPLVVNQRRVGTDRQLTLLIANLVEEVKLHLTQTVQP